MAVPRADPKNGRLDESEVGGEMLWVQVWVGIWIVGWVVSMVLIYQDGRKRRVTITPPKLTEEQITEMLNTPTSQIIADAEAKAVMEMHKQPEGMTWDRSG